MAGGLRCCVPASRPSRAVPFWTAAALLVLVLAASGVPSPLYRVYQERFGFSAGVLTTVFGIYAFALLAALLVVGALSDHVGRRPVLAGALVLQAGAMVLFLLADGVGWLLVARLVQGVSVGALTGALAGAAGGASGIPQELIDGLEGRIYVSLAAPWFHKAALQRAGHRIDLRPVHGPRPELPPRQ